MSDVDLIINVHTNGIKDVANLSASVKALTANLREITIPMSKLDVQSRAVNKALGMTNRGMNDHAKTVKQLKENQRALGEESKRLKSNIIAYTGAIRAAGGPTTALGKELTSTKAHLQSMSAAMRGARVRAFGSDVSSISLRLQKMGKDAQFVGRSLMINLTAPIMLFGRLGFQSLLAVDKEATRLTKVFDSVAMSAEQAAMKVGVIEGNMPTLKQQQMMDKMVSNFKALDTQLTGVSSKFGVSKDIVVGLASDFAELGIVSQENVVTLTELTTTIEKLGGMDIGPAKDLSQALYFNAKRAYEANGAFKLVTSAVERETMAIGAAKTQLAMFNAIENVTALTLQDLADALPEVGSMATAFGLSMTEAAAMLAPMKAAGLDVGASATSIKTSLQRLILPTAKNIKFMDQLAKQYGVTSDATDAFKNTTKTGLVGLEAIVDVFSKVKDSAAGTEGALKLMSQLFEKRQGPRMYIAIEQLASFNKQLKSTGSAENTLASVAQEAIVKFNELNNTSLKATIDNFRDIGILARVAAGTVGATVDGYKGKGSGGALSSDDIATAKAARSAVAAQVRKDRSEGKDSFAGVTSEAGRAMLVELAGPITATEIANQELDISLKSLSVSVQKIKNNFKLFAAEILRNLGPAIKWLSAKLEQFQKYWEGLTQSTRDNITKVIGFVLLFLAAIGPVVIAMGTFQASIGVLGRGFAFFLPKIKNASGELVSFGSSAETARRKIDAFYEKLRKLKSGGIKSGDTLDALNIKAPFTTSAATAESIAAARSSAIPPKFIPTPNAGLPPAFMATGGAGGTASVAAKAEGGILKNYLASIGKKTTDFEKVLKIEQTRILKNSGFSSSDITLAKNSRGPGGRLLPMTPGSAAARTALAPGGIADRTNAENILFAKAEAHQTALHAKQMAYIAQENALKMQAYNGEVLAQSMNHQANLAHEAKMQATKLKNEQMSAKGITTRYKKVITETKDKLGFSKGMKGTMVPQRVYNGMDISEDTANRIGRGGIRSRFTKANIFGKKILQKVETETGGLTPRKFARGLLPDFQKPTTPFPKMSTSGPLGFIKQASQNIGQRMMPTNLVGAQGAANVRGVFNVGKGAVKETFAKSMQGGRQAVANLAIKNEAEFPGKEAGKIKNAATAMKGFMGATKGGTAAMKLMKIALVSSGIGVLILLLGVAILVIVKNFDKFKSAGAGAFAKIKEAFDIFKNALLEIARPFLDLFAMFGKGGKEGKTAVGGLAAAFGGIATAVKWVAGMFQKFVMGVIQPLLYGIINVVMFVVSIFKGNWKDAFGYLLAAVSQVVKFVVLGFALLIKGVIQVVAFGIKLVIGYFTLIPKAVAKSFSWLSKLPGMGFLKSIGNGIDNVIDGLYGMVDAGKGAAMGAVDSIANSIIGGLNKGIDKGVKKSKGAIDLFKNKGATSAEPAGEAIADDMGDGLAKGDIGGKIKKEIEDVLQTLQDYVAGELKNAVDKYVAKAEDALKKQKEAALKVFQVQIETLDKLEKAQESLTRTMAYESEKRKRIDDKALTDEQYRRNYALAVYEGRTDDARMLQLQQGADEKAFSEDIKAIETKRAEELAKENLDALKTAINEAKDAAGKFFDESLIKFQEAAALVTKFPPVTIQDYQDQVGKLHTLTTDAALANSTEFGNMFETFVTTINDKMPNKVIGAFSMNLDDLVIEAQKKYGLGGNPEEKSIIGATLGMLADIGGTFGDKKQTVVDAFGEVSSGLVGNFTAAKTEILRVVDEEFLTPFAAASTTFVTNWETIYKQAFIDGNISIVNSFRNTVALNKDLMEEMAKNLDPAVNKWIELKAKIDAANDAASGGAAGGGGDGSSTTNPYANRTDAYGNTGFGRTSVPKPGIIAPKYAPKSNQAAMAGNAFKPNTVFVPTSATPGYKGYAKGGVIPSRSSESGYIGSGFISAPTQEGVPALLHGGEYILNAKAVSRLGIGALEKLNNNLIPRFAKGGYVAPKKGGIPFGGEDKILANSTQKAPQPLQGPYATSIPVVASPTINLKTLPLVKNTLPGEGGISTVRSASFGIGKGEVLLPTVVQGKILSDTNAFNAYANGGYKNHLGIYADTAAANKAAEVIHLSEANRIGQVAKAQAQRNVDLKNAGIAKNFIGPIAPVKQGLSSMKPEKQGLSWWKEILRPKNSFALIGGTVAGILGAPSGPGAFASAAAGATVMGGVGAWVEQLFDNKKGFQIGDIAKNALWQGTLQIAGAGLAKIASPLVEPGINYVKPMVASKFPGVASYLSGTVARLLGKTAEQEIGNLVIHGSPQSGLDTLLPRVSRSEPIGSIPKVWTFDASKTSAANAIDKLLPYADSTLGAGDQVGSIYVGSAKGLNPVAASMSPTAWTQSAVDVLHEIAVSGKTKQQIIRELEQVLASAASEPSPKISAIQKLFNLRTVPKVPVGPFIDSMPSVPNFQTALPAGPRPYGLLMQGKAPEPVESIAARLGQLARINGAIPLGRSTVPMPTASVENILMHGGPSELLGGTLNPEFIRGGFGHSAIQGAHPSDRFIL
ncbi:Phage tail tape measure protein, partial [uncultured Caudovirales phage]